MNITSIPNEEKVYQLALSLVRGVGFTGWKKLITQFGTAQLLFHCSPYQLKQTLRGTPSSVVASILHQDTLKKAEEILYTHEQKNIQVLSFFDTTYPERLKHIDKPPSFLYCQGNIDFTLPKSISIVGTRRATTYGKKFVENLIADLRECNIMVVSGLAYGIDIHAHRMCLHHQLSTVGVMASGLDIIYPAAHKKIALDMLASGGLVSEAPMGTLLESFQFPHRNRLIAGLSDATVVVEADYKSGAIITADFANAYHREVFALPGSIYEPFSVGCNHLIKTQQAHVVTKLEDIFYIMNWSPKSQATHQLPTLSLQKFSELNTEEQKIVQALTFLQKEVHIDELSQHTALLSHQLSPVLLQLELKNVLQPLPGNKFKLLPSV